MRSRSPSPDQVADVARRRLERLGAELAGIRDDTGGLAEHPEGSGRTGPSTSTASPGDSQPGPLDPGSPSAPGGESGLSGTPPGRHARRSRRAAAGDWLRDRVPPSLHEGVAMRGHHVAVVAILVLLGAAATLWWVARAGGSTTTLPPVSSPPSPLVSLAPAVAGVAAAPSGAATAPAAGSTPAPAAAAAPGAGSAAGVTGPPPGAGPAATATVSAQVVVDVAGKVRRPGIATLPLGSRVADALRAAGGPRRGVRLGAALNLARVLVDGEQILVGVRAPPGPAAAAAAAPTTSAGGTGTTGPAALVDINTASSTELEALPEVGPVTAQAIVDFRTQNGPFTSVDELLEVSGIGDATLAKVAPFVTL
jgi:competence protein ComEA